MTNEEHKCPICSKVLKTKSGLKVHISRTHNRNKAKSVWKSRKRDRD